MSIEFRRGLGSDAVQAVKDFTLDATYAATAKKGDIVKLNASGQVVAAATNDILVLGVYEGPNIKLAADTVTTGKVRTAAEAVYEITVTGGTPVPGLGYPVTLSSGDYVLNAATNATPLFKVVGALGNGNYEAVITGRQLV